MIEIPIVSLCYNYSQSKFQTIIPPSTDTPAGYELIARQIDRRDAEIFIGRMHSKYVRGRKQGRYPTADILRTELELFVKLKDYKRKSV